MSGSRPLCEVVGVWELNLDVLREVIEKDFGGNVAALSRASNVPRWRIYDWLNKGRQPSCGDLLQVARASGEHMIAFYRRKG